MSKKTNPRKVHATGEDVKKSFTEGIDLGCKQAIKLCLYICLDKHGAPKEDVQQLAREIAWASGLINEYRLSWSFIDKVLHENGVEVRLI